MAIKASISSTTNQLTILGDRDDNPIIISRTIGGTILINGGDVPITGGTPMVQNISRIFVSASRGADQIQFDESNGSLPEALLFGGFDDDLITGGSGDDTLGGGSGNDTLRGGDGDDRLSGNFGDDEMFGEDGDDEILIVSGDGNALIEGGDGNDTVRAAGSQNEDDQFRVSANGDRVRFQRTNLAVSTSDIGTTETIDIDARGGDDFVEISAAAAALTTLDFDGGDGADTVEVNGVDDARDEIEISSSNGVIQLQRTNLTPFTVLVRDSETLIVNGGGGNDSIRATSLGAGINLELNGGEGNDLLLGGSGDDVLRGGNGDDTLLGEQGNDTIFAGAGNDRIFVLNSNIDGSDVIDGGSGNDTLTHLSNSNIDDEIRISNSGERVLVERQNFPSSTLDITSVEVMSFEGGGGDETIVASNLAAGLTTLDIKGEEGDDVIIGSQGDDTIDGGAGNDILLGKEGDDTIQGGAGIDLISIDSEFATGSDVIEGGSGRDTVRVAGARTAGDQFRVSANGDRVRFERTNLTVFTTDIGTTETIDVEARGGDDSIEVSMAAALTTLDFDGGDGIDTVEVNGDDDARDEIEISSRIGGRVRLQRTNLTPFTVLVRDSETLIVNGGGGNDSIRATSLGAGINLELNGGEGNDLLIGGDDSDVLIGVATAGVGEFDQLTGGGGSDRFVLGDEQQAYYLGQGDIDHAAIFDFSLAENDVIQLHGNAEDYVLANFTEGIVSGVAIALQSTGDLVGAVVGISTIELSLDNAAAFDFVG